MPRVSGVFLLGGENKNAEISHVIDSFFLFFIFNKYSFFIHTVDKITICATLKVCRRI